jgi:hypothetical protein
MSQGGVTTGLTTVQSESGSLAGERGCLSSSQCPAGTRGALPGSKVASDLHHVKVKVKFTLQQDTKAQKGSKYIVLLFL